MWFELWTMVVESISRFFHEILFQLQQVDVLLQFGSTVLPQIYE